MQIVIFLSTHTHIHTQGDSLVQCLDLQSGLSTTKPLSTVSVGDLLETGQTSGSDLLETGQTSGSNMNTKWRRVARLWPAEAESREVFQLSEVRVGGGGVR